ncbi:unnamed protein product [Porites lobata]|uniref:Tyr recombinase domain-containing protein n=1 Tax=Porites lobata TaxID=104759 RepID=A0ABN8RJD2_9CNID|nr:unnamed protein product [Porites lobata]
MLEIKRLKRDAPPSFNENSNEDQYNATKCVLEAVEDASSSLERKDLPKTKEYPEKGMSLLKERQKLILLADKSPYGWKTVLEYKHHDLAEDDEDEKKIYRAEARAARTSKRFAARGSNSQRRGSSVARFSQLAVAHLPNAFDSELPFLEVQLSSYQVKSGDVPFSVRGRLRKSIQFWREIDAPRFILDTIEFGYKLPLIQIPPPFVATNNNLALQESEFVESAISELLSLECITEVFAPPAVPALQRMALDIHRLCLLASVSIDMQWIPRDLNISKFVDLDDYSINDGVFYSLDELWGPHTCDRFACHYNAKLPKFNTRLYQPGTSGVNAFAQDWSNDNNWLCPPVCLTSKVLSHLKVCNAAGTLVVPLWRSAYFWPRLCFDGLHWSGFVHDWVILPDLPNLFVRGKAKNSIFGRGSLPFPSVALRIDFSTAPRQDFWATSLQFSLEVSSLMDKLRSTVLASRAPGTSLNYTRIFNRWRFFATEVLGIVAVFPVEPIHCALFLQYLLDSTKSVSTINCAFYAFKWLHDLAGVGSPTSHPTVVAVKEGAIRLSSCPVKHRKEPLEAEHLRQLIERTDLNDLLQLRNLVMFVLAFSGFLRFSELSLILAKDIKFSNGVISVFIEKSKADQLREGQSVVIAESGSSLCRVTLLKLYMNSSHLSLDSDEYIFRPISASNSCKRLVSVNKPISYSTYRQSFKKSFLSAKNTYIKDSLASRLDVSKSLSL